MTFDPDFGDVCLYLQLFISDKMKHQPTQIKKPPSSEAFYSLKLSLGSTTDLTGFKNLSGLIFQLAGHIADRHQDTLARFGADNPGTEFRVADGAVLGDVQTFQLNLGRHTDTNGDFQNVEGQEH